MFASKHTQVVNLPSDPSVAVTIRRLSWLQRQDARKVSQQTSAKDIASMGADVLAYFRTMEEAEQQRKVAAGEAIAPAPVDPLATHDMLTVLVCGVKSWSVEVPVSKETLADLEADDAEFLARQILGMTPGVAQTEADRKNDA